MFAMNVSLYIWRRQKTRGPGTHRLLTFVRQTIDRYSSESSFGCPFSIYIWIWATYLPIITYYNGLDNRFGAVHPLSLSLSLCLSAPVPGLGLANCEVELTDLTCERSLCWMGLSFGEWERRSQQAHSSLRTSVFAMAFVRPHIKAQQTVYSSSNSTMPSHRQTKMLLTHTRGI